MAKLISGVAQSRGLTVLVAVALIAASVTLAVRAFGLTLVGALGLYFVIWWIGLFAVLPFGVRSQVEAGDVTAGTEPGAPSVPALSEKAIWTTILAGCVLNAAAAILPLAGL